MVRPVPARKGRMTVRLEDVGTSRKKNVVENLVDRGGAIRVR